jgi:peptidoglycan/xylan/chitin deacetylase (PgdA/CDA1 family)
MNAHDASPYPRDFLGYGGNPPDPKWPADARVAVSLVVNVEAGSELSVADGDERNESIYEIVEAVDGVPNYCLASHFDYGPRVGYWRIMRTLEATGVRPVGWHTKGAPSPNTRRLLVEEGGFLYDSDAYDDDLPHVVEVAGHSHVVVPYAFDTNDMRYMAGGTFVHAGDFARYCIDAFDTLWQEAERYPAMMSVGLHPRLIGRPGRIAGLERFLEHVRATDHVWLARRMDIAHHWRALMGLPAWTDSSTDGKRSHSGPAKEDGS